VQRRIQLKAAGHGSFAAKALEHDDAKATKRSRKVRRVMVIVTIVPLVIAALLVYVVSDYSPWMTHTGAPMDVKYTADLMSGCHDIAADPGKQRRLAELGDVRGEKFFEAAFRAKLLDDSLVSRLVSWNSTTDSRAGREWIAADEPMPPNSCSFTAPRADMLLEVLSLQGKNRCVVFCYNSRNWHNNPDRGVLAHWSDGDVAVYMTLDEAHDDWGITEEEWADPAGKLFGIKAPFQHTYE
jgi:hypothetical protein